MVLRKCGDLGLDLLLHPDGQCLAVQYARCHAWTPVEGRDRSARTGPGRGGCVFYARDPALVITRPMTNRTSPIPSTDSPTTSARSGVTLISCHFAVVSDVMPKVVMKPRMETKTPLNSVRAPSIVTKLPAPSRGGRACRSTGSARGLCFRP